ncbi:MAG TPA: hypothetical protein EYN66_01415 [Myxococcales bacterium]|nr:hypothetical protein [Myxococcales bacterium]
MDMVPAMPLGYDLDGVVVDDKGLNIPVPREARVRVSIVLPDYTNEVVVVSGWGSVDDDNLNRRPWESQIISWTLTILEGAEE